MLWGFLGVGLGCIVPSVEIISYWFGAVVLDRNKSLCIVERCNEQLYLYVAVISEELELIF